MNVAEIADLFKDELKNKKELYLYGYNFTQNSLGIDAVKYGEKELKISV